MNYYYGILFVLLLGFAVYHWPSRDRVKQGYDYAINEIHRLGNRAIVNLSSKLQESKTFGDYDDFDQGVEKAIQEHFRGR